MIPFSNEEISMDSLPDYKQVTFTPIRKQYWTVIVLQFIVTFIFIGVAIWLITYADDLKDYRWVTLAAFAMFMVLYIILKKAAFKRRGFVLREHDILYRRGVLANTTTIIAFSRIQHVALNEGAFSRMWHLAQLQIYTAGGSSSDLKISGLGKEDAEKIKELIMRRMPQVNNPLPQKTENLND